MCLEIEYGNKMDGNTLSIAMHTKNQQKIQVSKGYQVNKHYSLGGKKNQLICLRLGKNSTAPKAIY